MRDLGRTCGIGVVLGLVAVGALGQSADLSVTLTGPSIMSPGTDIYYNFAVTNLGPDDSTGAQLNCVLPANTTLQYFNPGSWGCSAPAVGETGTISCGTTWFGNGSTNDFQLSIRPAVAPGLTVELTVTVTSLAMPDPVTTNNQATVSTLIATQTDVQVAKDDGVTAVAPGDTVHYTVTVTNVASYDATGVMVADTFPSGLEGCTWTCTGSPCPVGSGSGAINHSVDLRYMIAPSVTYAVTCTVAAAASGTITNTVTATLPAGQVDTNPVNNTASDADNVVPRADLSITKDDGVTSVAPEGSVAYTITVANAGPSAVTGATVTDTFPAVLTCSWTCAGAACAATSGSGSIAEGLDLAPGASVTYTASCTVAAGSTGSLTNTATVAPPSGVPDPVPTDNTATDTDQVLSPVGPGFVTGDSIVIDTNGNGYPDPDDQRIYLNQLGGGVQFQAGPWGAFFLSLLDTNGDGILDEGSYLHPGGFTQTVSFGVSSALVAGRISTAAAAPASSASSFSFREVAPGGAIRAEGSASMHDGDGDGRLDYLTGQGHGMSLTMGSVGSDVTGDGHPDYLSIPWSQANLVGIVTTDATPDPQFWIPLVDLDGDGVPETVAFDVNAERPADPALRLGFAGPAGSHPGAGLLGAARVRAGAVAGVVRSRSLAQPAALARGAGHGCVRHPGELADPDNAIRTSERVPARGGSDHLAGASPSR